MSQPAPLLAIALLLAIAGAPARESTAAAQDPPKASVNEALTRGMWLEFVDTPLKDVADYLISEHSINVVLDERALADVGIDATATVTIALRKATLGTALRLMLSQLDLTFIVEDDLLLITTPEESKRRLRTVVYDVNELLKPPGAQQAYEDDRDELTEAICTAVAPESWDDVGGPGSICVYRRSLVVSQSDELQRQIRSMLARLGVAITSKPGETRPPDEFDRAMEKALSFDFDDVPLADVAAFLAEATGLEVYLDALALEDMGLATDAPVTAKGKNVGARAGLRRLLRPLDLAWRREENVLVITTAAEAELSLSVEFYQVVDLVTPEDADPSERAARDYDSLVELVLTTITPDAWDQLGGPGSVWVYRGVLVVSQTEGAHRQIADLFGELRRRARGQEASARNTAEAALRARLRRPATVRFHEIPMSDFVESLRREHELPIVVDTRAMEDLGIDLDTPVTLRVSDVRLETVLELALRALDLTWLVRGDTLWITTREEAENSLVTEIYPIGDLVEVDGQTGPSPADLIAIITGTIATDTWDDVGGRGMISPYRDLLVVSQTDRVQGRIDRLLKDLHARAGRAAP